MRVGIFSATLVITVAILASSAAATVYVNRVPNPNPPYYTIQPLTISSNTTWNADTYVVEATVTVNTGVSLGIASGSIVQVASNVGIYINGNLSASNVAFNHLSSGYWLGIYLSPNSGASSLVNCSISYSGAYNGGYGLNVNPHGPWAITALYVDDCNPHITGCTFMNSQTNGLSLWGSAATITGTTFQNMGANY